VNVIQLQEGPHLLLATPSRPRYQPASLLDPPIASSWPPAAAPPGFRFTSGPGGLCFGQFGGWRFQPAHFGLATVKEPGGPVRAFDTYINSSIRLSSIEQLKRLLENYQKM